MFCPKCGNELADTARFCGKCGSAIGGVPDGPAQQPPEPQKFNFTAPAFSGEAACGAVADTAARAVSNAISGPGGVIGAGLKSFFSSVGAAVKDPKRLIPALALALVWLVLNVLQACGVNPFPTRILSFLTFAGGGTSGGVIGAVGGIVGKGIFAGALVSLIGLFTRKGGVKRSFGETVKGAFGVSLDTLWAYLCGIGAAMLLYLFISGGATRASFMGGIAAAFLAARAALSGGFLRQLLGSFTKSKNASHPNVSGIVRGLAAGFAAAALLGMTGVKLILLIPGGLLFAGGGVMMILQAAGVVKFGKGAKA